MIRIMALACCVVALAGCGSSSGGGSYSRSSYRESSELDDALSVGLLGGTAFLSGYNQNRQTMPMVFLMK